MTNISKKVHINPTGPVDTASEGDAIGTQFARSTPPLFKGFASDSTTISDVLYSPVSPDRRVWFENKLEDSNPLYKSLAKYRKDAPDSIRVMNLGVHHHPIDFAAATRMRSISPHHSSCLDTVVDMTIGNGFADPETQRVLDELTENGIVAELDKMLQGLLSTGQGYLEVVRNEVGNVDSSPQRIISQPSTHMMRVQHGPSVNEQHFIFSPYAYMMRSGYGTEDLFSGTEDINTAPFARFGHVRELLQILPMTSLTSSMGPIAYRDVGEVIDFTLPTGLWEHYGAPRWMAANSYMELNRQQLQRTYTYMHNRGTPDTLTMLWGVRLTDEQKAALQDLMNANTAANYGKSTLLTFPNSAQQSGKAQIEKFNDNIDGDTFQQINDVCALAACSAWRVPPVLAGVTTSRSMSAASEQTQALAITQMLVINKLQELVEAKLRRTLGSSAGIKRLAGKDFKLKKLTDVTDMAALNVMARQRQTDSAVTRATEEGDADPQLRR